MATTLLVSATSIHHISRSRSRHRPFTLNSPSNRNTRIISIRCTTTDDDDDDDKKTSRAGGSESGNLLLKSAWYASEVLGIAASYFIRRPEAAQLVDDVIEQDVDGSFIERSIIVDSIKQDFQRSYFVTGAVTVDAYEDDCEFADPAGSFKGVGRFKRNCTNFGSLIDKSSMKLMKWQDFEDKGIGHWRFSCTMSFPWKPILSATGYTEYYLSKESGKVCRHVEHWNVPKMALFKQLLKPRRGFWGK